MKTGYFKHNLDGAIADFTNFVFNLVAKHEIRLFKETKKAVLEHGISIICLMENIIAVVNYTAT